MTAVVVREKPPMRQRLRVTTPGGKVHRWAEDDPHADRVIEGLQDSDTAPGGDNQASGSLARKPGVDYSDMQRGSTVEILGAGDYTVSEYRLERAPRTAGDRLVMDPSAVGFQAHLTDDESAAEIFLDADMTAWGPPSSRWVVANESIDTSAEVELLPAGDPNGAGVPSISHGTTNALSEHRQADSWYDSGGIELGRVILDWINVKGIGIGESEGWSNVIGAGASDETSETLFDFVGTTTKQKELAIPEGRFFLEMWDRYNGTFPELVAWQAFWQNVRILGRHGLPLYGTWPNVGLLASDVIPYVLQRWAPLLNFTTGPYGSIRPSSFPIPQLAFKERTTAQEMVTTALKFEMLEWGVWPGPDGPTFYLNPRGEREGRKRWRARVRPAQLEETGQQFDKVRNGMLVSYQDPDGTTRWVGPPGSGANIESARLVDLDPLNPANQIPGLKRWGKAALQGKGSPEAAIEAGAQRLEASKELDGSGKATLTGYVEDEHGALWPYYCVHAGDLIEFLDASIPGYRYIVNAERSRATRSVSIELDAPPDTSEALSARQDAALVDLGLAS